MNQGSTWWKTLPPPPPPPPSVGLEEEEENHTANAEVSSAPPPPSSASSGMMMTTSLTGRSKHKRSSGVVASAAAALMMVFSMTASHHPCAMAQQGSGTSHYYYNQPGAPPHPSSFFPNSELAPVGPYSPNYKPGPNPYIHSRLDDFDYYDPDRRYYFDDSNGYRRRPPQESPGGYYQPMSDEERLRLAVMAQENATDGFHFSQRYELDRTDPTPRIGMMLSDAACDVSPTPRSNPSATYFVVECPANVHKLALEFASGAPFKDVLDDKSKRAKKLTFNLGEQKIETKILQACVDMKRPETCQQIRIDIRRSLSVAPQIRNIIISQGPHPLPPFNSKQAVYNVKLKRNEPVEAVISMSNGYFVDELSPRAESRLTDGNVRFVFRPRGSVYRKQLFAVDADRAALEHFLLEVETEESLNSNIYRVTSQVGRLDPPFQPHQYAYYLRVDTGATSTRLKIEGMDDENLVCEYETGIAGKRGRIVGRGSTEPILLGSPFPRTIILDCYNANAGDNFADELLTEHSRYVFNVVRQTGGSTLATIVDVVGGEMEPTFNPMIKGPYEVSLASNANRGLSWVSFLIKPANKRAYALVEGFPVDAHGQSPYFRINSGERRKFTLTIRTPENAVREEYYVNVHRPTLGLASTSAARFAGSVLGWLSALVSSTRAYHFLHNVKYLQFLSATSRFEGTPETYDAYARSFNPWNLQWSCPTQVHFENPHHFSSVGRYDYITMSNAWNETFVAPPIKYGEILNYAQAHTETDISDLALPNKGDATTTTTAAAAALPLMLVRTRNGDGWQRAFYDESALSFAVARAFSNPQVADLIQSRGGSIGSALSGQSRALKEEADAVAAENPEFYDRADFNKMSDDELNYQASRAFLENDEQLMAGIFDWIWRQTPATTTAPPPPMTTTTTTQAPSIWDRLSVMDEAAAESPALFSEKLQTPLRRLLDSDDGKAAPPSQLTEKDKCWLKSILRGKETTTTTTVPLTNKSSWNKFRSLFTKQETPTTPVSVEEDCSDSGSYLKDSFITNPFWQRWFIRNPEAAVAGLFGPSERPFVYNVDHAGRGVDDIYGHAFHNRPISRRREVEGVHRMQIDTGIPYYEASVIVPPPPPPPPPRRWFHRRKEGPRVVLGKGLPPRAVPPHLVKTKTEQEQFLEWVRRNPEKAAERLYSVGVVPPELARAMKKAGPPPEVPPPVAIEGAIAGSPAVEGAAAAAEGNPERRKVISLIKSWVRERPEAAAEELSDAAVREAYYKSAGRYHYGASTMDRLYREQLLRDAERAVSRAEVGGNYYDRLSRLKDRLVSRMSSRQGENVEGIPDRPYVMVDEMVPAEVRKRKSGPFWRRKWDAYYLAEDSARNRLTPSALLARREQQKWQREQYENPASLMFSADYERVDPPPWTEVFKRKMSRLGELASTVPDGWQERLTRKRQLMAIDYDEKMLLMTTLESGFKESEKLLNYANAVVLTTAAVLVLGVLYGALWVVKLHQGDFLTIRRDYPVWLHPARFWSFIGDLAFLSYAQSCAGLLFTEFKDVPIYAYGFNLTPRKLSWFCFFAIFAYPLFFVVVGGYMLTYFRSILVFSRTLQRYHDSFCVRAKAMRCYAPWLPIFKRLFTIEITEVLPIVRSNPGDQIDGIGVIFAEEPRTGGSWNEANALRALGVPLKSTNKQDEEHLSSNEEEGEPFQNTGVVSFDALCRAVDLAKTHDLKYYAGGDAVRASLNDEMFNAQYDLSNARVHDKYSEALVGYGPYRLRNPYDQDISLLCEYQIRHLTPLAQILDRRNDRLAMIIPREHLEMTAVDNVHNLFGKAQKGNLFYWLIDRLAVFSMMLFMGYFHDYNGWRTDLVFAITALALAVVYIPGALSSGVSKWYRVMYDQLEERRQLKIQQELSQAKFNVWPFKSPGMKDLYYTLEDRRYDLKMISQYYAAYVKLLNWSHKTFNNPFWSTRIWSTTKSVVKGPVFTELTKFLCMMSVFMANVSIRTWNDGLASWTAILVTTAGLICLNMDAMVDAYRDLKPFIYDELCDIRRMIIGLMDLLYDPTSLSDRLSFYMTQLGRSLRMEKRVSYIYPGFQPAFVRDYRCHEACMVSNEMGLQLPGKIFRSEMIDRKERYESEPITRARYDLHKTLFKSSGIGVYRHQLDRGLPVQVPFKSFYFGVDGEISRLAATIQIVNHNGLRYVPWTRRHDYDDDSYLSLYTNPQLIPPSGKLRRKFKGHGYSVRLNKLENELVIRGPNIRAGRSYVLKSSANAPPKDENYSYSLESARSSEHVEGRFEGTGFCTEPGRLIVKVPPGRAPDLHEEVEVTRPSTGETIFVDPVASRVHYDAVHGEMTISSRFIRLAEEEYRVHWEVRKRGQKFRQEVRAELDGELIIQLSSENLSPDLSSYLQLRDEAGKNVVDIDCRDTNAHEFFLPSARPADDITGFFAALRSTLNSETNCFKQRNFLNEVVIDPIPCTVIQCVDPVRRLYRVDPDFREALRHVRAQIEEVAAMKMELNDLDRLTNIWYRVLTPAEYVALWREQGVIITDKNGRFYDPMRRPAPNKGVLGGAARIRVEVERRLRSQETQLQRVQEELLLWEKAYRDTDLMQAQAERDMAVWRNEHATEMTHLVQRLLDLKAPYERMRNFVYPMVLEEKMLQRRGNWDGQFREWQQQLDAWLIEEENADVERETFGGLTCWDFTSQEVLQALRYTMRRPEALMDGQMRSVLHYVTPSRSVRGVRINWRPDPLSAHCAVVRLWTELPDGTPNWDKEPVWIPCMLRLTANAIKIMMPCYDDTTRNYGPGTPYHWRHHTGWYIPLKCFERIECSMDKNLPIGYESNPNIHAFSGKIVCRRNMAIRVSENYVCKINYERDQPVFNNQPFLGDGISAVPYRIMLGRTVGPREAQNYPSDEQHGYGDLISALPLTFRVNSFALKKWQSVIWACQMDKPPKDLGDFVGQIPTAASEGILKPSQSTTIPKSESMIQEALTVHTSEISSLSGDEDNLSRDGRADVSVDASRSFEDASSIQPSTHYTDNNNMLNAGTSMQPINEDAQDFRLEAAYPQPTKKKPSPTKGAMYTGQFQNWRYNGQGKLYDDEGRLVYEGTWVNGKRWGQDCLCYFTDAFGVRWKYQGGFEDDEFFGKGRLVVEDPKEAIEIMRKYPTLRNRYKILAFDGMFKRPMDEQKIRSLAEKEVSPFDGDESKPLLLDRSNSGLPMEGTQPPRVDLNQIKRMFVEYGGDGLLIDGVEPRHEQGTGRKTLVINVDRALSGIGNEDAIAASLAALSEKYYYGKTPRELLSRQHSLRSQSEITVTSRDGNEDDLQRANDEYLPHTIKWARKLDPGLGYANLESRLVRGRAWFVDGSIYDGHFDRQGRPHGDGDYECGVCHLRYCGNFVDGLPECVSDGVMTGKGIKEIGDSPPLSVYCGGLMRGMRHGIGLCAGQSSSSAPSYYLQGSWFKDVLDGPDAVIVVQNPKDPKFEIRRYEGPVKNCVPDGPKGKLEWRKGHVYEGAFREGRREGFGTMYDKKGRAVFAGDWINDLPEGRVARYYVGGDLVYTGDIKHGERCGVGEVHRTTNNRGGGGLIYEGQWSSDAPHGRGVMMCVDGVYEGEFRDGKRHGKGRFVYRDDPCANGRQRFYEGDWDNDQPHGIGKYLSEDGAENTYQFDHGILVEASLKKYKDGFCGKVPSVKGNPLVAESTVHAEDVHYWGRRCDLKPDILREEVQTLGQGIWKRHQEENWEISEPNFEATLCPISRDIIKEPLMTGSDQLSSSQRTDEDRNDLEHLFTVVTLHNARRLHSPSLMHQLSPYVRIVCGSQMRRSTRSSAKGGVASWESKVVFPPKVIIGRRMFLEVYDHDLSNQDRFCGACEFPLNELFMDASCRSLHRVLPLWRYDKEEMRDVEAGEISVTVELLEKSPEMDTTIGVDYGRIDSIDDEMPKLLEKAMREASQSVNKALV